MSLDALSSVDSTGTLTVVSPWLVLFVAASILAMELSLHALAPALLLRLRSTAAQRAALKNHAARVHALRLQSNQLNSPATFAEYAKTQRALQRELKAQAALQAEVGAPGSNATAAANPLVAAQTFALTHGIKFLVYIVCFFVCFGTTLFVVPTSGWLAPLTYTPLRLLLGEVGIIPWLACCSLVSTSIKAWL